MEQCAGHYGYVRLELPVFHIGYLKNVQSILQCVCKACSRILLGPVERAAMLKKMRHVSADALKKAQIYKRVVDRCKTQSTCSQCGARNGTIRKVAGSGSIKLAHEKWRGVKPHHLPDDEEYEDFNEGLSSAMAKSSAFDLVSEPIVFVSITIRNGRLNSTVFIKVPRGEDALEHTLSHA